ncbi:XRE family transcriptional regulator, partial [Streptomyces sp. XY593]
MDGFDVLTRPRRRCAARQWALHPSLRWALGAITAGSAFVRNGRMDVLAVNPLGRAF